MRLALLIVLAMVITACEATVAAPETEINPNTPAAPFGTPPTSSVPTETRVPTNTPASIPASVTPEPTLNPEPTTTEVRVEIDPLMETDIVPPLRLNLPSGWTTHSDALLISELGGTSAIPFGFYSGPVTGGRGNIVVLFGFSNLIPGINPDAPANLYADALRLLLFAVIEPSCEYSFEEETTYTIAGRQARGTVFAADQCPDGLPSLQGWFGTMVVDGLNFAFYSYTEPHEAMNSASRGELQAILDSIVFDMSMLPTAAPTATVTP